MIVEAPDEYLGPDLFLQLRSILGRSLYAKCEGFNFGWSIKLRTARFMVDEAERRGELAPGATIVESSSGNLGVALAVIAAARGMNFICVVDRNCNPQSVALMRSAGACVEQVVDADANGTYLQARKFRVRELCADRPDRVWLNQYENSANVLAHVETTAPSVDAQFEQLDVLFVGAGTGGTLMGCVEYFRARRSEVRIVAVDSVGSVNFGGPAAGRHISGLGTSQEMSLICADSVDAVEWVDERDSITMCRRLAARGVVLGGSSGSVIHGALRWLDRNDPLDRLCAVAVSPDFGFGYLDTVYNDDWCETHFPGLELDRASGAVGALAGWVDK